MQETEQSEPQYEFFAIDEAATLAFAARLSKLVDGKGVVLLEGQLGAGKTTFSRGLLRAMGHEGAVKSPTFTLVEPYQIGTNNVYHFDLYRLVDPEELEYLGVDDYLNGESLCLIEWAEKGLSYLPEWDIKVQLKVEGTSRRIALSSNTEYGMRISAALFGC